MFAKDVLRLDQKDEMALEVLKNLRIKNRFFTGHKKTNQLTILALVLIVAVVAVIVWPRKPTPAFPTTVVKTENVQNYENSIISAQEETNANFAEIKNMYSRKNTLIRELFVLSGVRNNTFLEELTELKLAMNKDISPKRKSRS